MLAGLKLDFVFIDTEHVPLGREQVAWMCQAYGNAGIAPIVRIPHPSAHLVRMTLDAGAAGVVAPYVERVAQVRELRGAVRYRPLQGERLEAALQDETVLEPALRDYVAKRNEGNSLIINVESVPAVARLDELLAEPGLDAVLIGPHDLSCSMGIPEQYDDPRFEETICSIITRTRAKGIGAGIHWPWGCERIARWIGLGANLIVVSGDITAAHTDLRMQLQHLRGPIAKLASPDAV
jgi:4-hydroxy-2-oxoheptanedioate aldolase